MTDPKYKAFTVLEPFFDIAQRGLVGHVDGARLGGSRAKRARSPIAATPDCVPTLHVGPRSGKR
jgi:hypothetical protein